MLSAFTWLPLQSFYLWFFHVQNLRHTDPGNLKGKAETWRKILLREIQEEFQGGCERFLRPLCTYEFSSTSALGGRGCYILYILPQAFPEHWPHPACCPSGRGSECPSPHSETGHRLLQTLSNITLSIICMLCKW